MRKSQIKFKLNQKLCYVAKKQAIKIEFLERLEDNSKKKDIKLENNNNLHLLKTQL